MRECRDVEQNLLLKHALLVASFLFVPHWLLLLSPLKPQGLSALCNLDILLIFITPGPIDLKIASIPSIRVLFQPRRALTEKHLMTVQLIHY
jgi:hypothetical protein